MTSSKDNSETETPPIPNKLLHRQHHLDQLPSSYQKKKNPMFSPFKYVRTYHRIYHSRKSVNGIRIRRNRYRKYKLTRYTYVPTSQRHIKSTTEQIKHHILNRKRILDITHHKQTLIKTRRVCTYVLPQNKALTYCSTQRKRDTYVEPSHRKIKKQKIDIP